MKQFKSMRVFDVDIDMSWRQEDADPIIGLEPDDFGGFHCSKRVMHIAVDRLKNNTQIEDTLIHECTHAVLGFSGLSELLKEGQEEAIACAMEHGLTNAVRFLVKQGYFKS